MAPRPGKPRRFQHSLTWGEEDEQAWRKLRRHAYDEGTNASKIVATLVTEYVNWPPALQAATLRKVRTANEGEG